jgi:hypothetical protein
MHLNREDLREIVRSILLILLLLSVLWALVAGPVIVWLLMGGTLPD